MEFYENLNQNQATIPVALEQCGYRYRMVKRLKKTDTVEIIFFSFPLVMNAYS